MRSRRKTGEWFAAGFRRDVGMWYAAGASGKREIVQGGEGIAGRRERKGRSTHLVGVNGTEGEVLGGDRALCEGVVERGLADVGHADDAHLCPQAISPSSMPAATVTLQSAGMPRQFSFPCKGGGGHGDADLEPVGKPAKGPRALDLLYDLLLGRHLGRGVSLASSRARFSGGKTSHVKMHPKGGVRLFKVVSLKTWDYRDDARSDDGSKTRGQGQFHGTDTHVWGNPLAISAETERERLWPTHCAPLQRFAVGSLPSRSSSREGRA